MLNYFIYWLITGIISVEIFKRDRNDKWFLAVVFMGGAIILPTLIITEYSWLLIKWLLYNTKRGKEITEELDKILKGE